MKIEQIYTGCLSQGAYYITSNGEAAIVDPLREITPYLERAKRDGVKIKYIFETHFHADFVSGHLDLASATAAKIIYGPNANTSFEAHIAQDGELFQLGDLTIQAIHTPGHTLESTCYLLLDSKQNAHCVFTGDTLFIGDVGRPDLAQKAATLTQEQLAALLFQSLRKKIMTLPDEVIVYPAHGAGSACGKHMSKETVSTIGEQKQNNYALRQDMSEDEFIAEVTEGLLPPPAYFPLNVALNKNGVVKLTEVMQRSLKALAPDEFEILAETGEYLLLDTRNNKDFAAGHIPNSINIGLDGQFAPWVGALINDIQQPILLIAAEGMEEESVKRLARVGYDGVAAYLDSGIAAWQLLGKPMEKVNRISASTFAQHLNEDRNAVIIDVRKPGEFEAEHLLGAINIPLDYINERWGDFPKDGHFYMHCAGGYRSMIASSILKSRGLNNFTEIEAGFAAIKQTSIPTTGFVCPSGK